jgi:hypothetical protein
MTMWLVALQLQVVVPDAYTNTLNMTMNQLDITDLSLLLCILCELTLLWHLSKTFLKC